MGNQRGCHWFIPCRTCRVAVYDCLYVATRGQKQYGLRAVFDIKLSLHLLDISVWTMVRSFFCIAPWFLFL